MTTPRSAPNPNPFLFIVAAKKSLAEVTKQGAYGKVKTHSESKFSQLSHLDEVFAALVFKSGLSDAGKVAKLPKDTSTSYLYCEKMLKKTSRSFSLVSVRAQLKRGVEG
jgi:hypothetical protein